MDYWQRKQAELSLLAEAAGEAAPRAEGSLWREKQRLRAALLARAPELAWTESNLEGVDRGRFSYYYQRFDLRVHCRRVFEEMYALDRRGGVAVGLWGGSGMGTISASLRALDGWLRAPRRLLVPMDAYFETKKLLPRLERLLASAPDEPFRVGDLYFLDSVTSEDQFPRLLGEPISLLQLVLFDTTCYDSASPLIGRVIDRCQAERVPLLMLRSHLKLDMLGLEYARLGSALLWLPPRPSRTLIKFARELREAIREELSLSGAVPTPAALFPLLAHPGLRALGQLRNAGMRAAQARAAAGLRGALPLTEPHHGCFLLLAPPGLTVPELYRSRRELVQKLCAAGVESVAAPSFGYDVVALTTLDLTAGPTLRLALPDLPEADVDRVVEVVRTHFAQR